MFTSKAQSDALKGAFLKTMDNDRSNDFQANQQIAHLASTMTDAEINQAYAAARDEATQENSKKNGLFDRNDPYKNMDSQSAQAAATGAFQANDWMNLFPFVPQQLLSFLSNFHNCY